MEGEGNRKYVGLFGIEVRGEDGLTKSVYI